MNSALFWALGVLALGAAGMAATAIAMRTVTSEPAVWHVDLSQATRTGKPNDFLMATEGYVSVPIDRTLSPLDRPPANWLGRVRDVALSEPRTELVAGSPDDGRMTFVQRSGVFAFPDYITVQADGADRAIWSRSRYGQSDLGVNAKRVERWMAALNR